MATTISFTDVDSSMAVALTIMHDILSGAIDLQSSDVRLNNTDDSHAVSLIDAVFFASNSSFDIPNDERGYRSRFMLDAIKTALNISTRDDIPRLLYTGLFVFCDIPEFASKYPEAVKLRDRIKSGFKFPDNGVNPSDVQQD